MGSNSPRPGLRSARWVGGDTGMAPKRPRFERAMPHPGSGLTPTLSRMRNSTILVAEDNPPSVELLHDHLDMLGYGVDIATDGKLALEMAMSGRYQLLILDVNMPGYDGVEVLQRLRAELANPPKVIVVTADRLATRRDELTQAGIDGYMTKPVDLRRLTLEVERVLAEAGAAGG